MSCPFAILSASPPFLPLLFFPDGLHNFIILLYSSPQLFIPIIFLLRYLNFHLYRLIIKKQKVMLANILQFINRFPPLILRLFKYIPISFLHHIFFQKFNVLHVKLRSCIFNWLLIFPSVIIHYQIKIITDSSTCLLR